MHLYSSRSGYLVCQKGLALQIAVNHIPCLVGAGY